MSIHRFVHLVDASPGRRHLAPALAAGLTLTLAALPASPVEAAACSVTLTSPANGSYQVQSPTFRWSSADCASYRVWFSPSGTFGPDKVLQGWQTTKTKKLAEETWDSYQAGAWASGVYWKVQGKSADGTLSFSGVRQVRMDPDLDDDGYSVSASDCDDLDPTVHPGAVETCNDKDDDCDGPVDEGLDADGDGYLSCAGDCDDTRANVNPAGIEVCDGVDNDCEGSVDRETDLTDGRSNDCDDLIDEVEWPGDGGTLDGAVESAALWGGIVEVLPGDWSVSGAEIRPPSGIRIVGSIGSPPVLSGAGPERILRIHDSVSEGPIEFSNLVFRGGAAPAGDGEGGAILSEGVDLRFVDCRFESNTAAASGGALAVRDARVELDGVVFDGNEAGSAGGGLFTSNATVDLTHVVLASNAAGADGGGAKFETSLVEGRNVLVVGNMALNGGGLHGDGMDLDFVTLVANAADGAGGCLQATASTFNSLVFHACSAGGVGDQAEINSVSMAYVVWRQAEFSGGGNTLTSMIEGSPVFEAYDGDLDWEDDDYDLRVVSPGFNAGDPSMSDPDGTRADCGAFGGPGGSW